MQFIESSITTVLEDVLEDVGTKLEASAIASATAAVTAKSPTRILIFYDHHHHHHHPPNSSSTGGGGEYNGHYFEHLRKQIQSVTFEDAITFVLYLTVSRRCFFKRKVPKKWQHDIDRFKRRLKLKFRNISSAFTFEYKFFEKHNTKFDAKMLQSDYVKPNYVVVDAQLLSEAAVLLDAFIKNGDGSYTEFKQKSNTILENVNALGIARPGVYSTTAGTNFIKLIAQFSALNNDQKSDASSKFTSEIVAALFIVINAIPVDDDVADQIKQALSAAKISPFSF